LQLRIANVHGGIVTTAAAVFIYDLIPETVESDGAYLCDVAQEVELFLGREEVRVLIHEDLPNLVLLRSFYHALIIVVFLRIRLL
jgi:hypothetical protein